MLDTLKEINRNMSKLFLVFFIAAAFIAPPDVISQIILVAEMMIVFGVVFLIVSRFRSYKEATHTKRREIFIAVCVFSILVGFCSIFLPRIFSSRLEQSEQIEGKEYQQ